MNNYFQINEHGTESVTFIPSISELYQYMEDNRSRIEGIPNLASRKVSKQRTRFTGTKSYKQAFDLAEKGWANRKTVSQIADQLNVTSTAQISNLPRQWLSQDHMWTLEHI